jgi:hypothetical protein
MKTRIVLAAACGLLLAGAAAFAQGQKKAPASPKAETAITVDGKKISIAYSAPSLRGRKFLPGIHQFGQVWRAGANNATALHTDADLQIGTLSVPKGDYTLYVLLDQEAWKLIVNKQTGQWGTVYQADQDLGRVTMKMGRPASTVETYKITLSEKGGKNAELRLEWEDFAASVPVTVK